MPNHVVTNIKFHFRCKKNIDFEIIKKNHEVVFYVKNSNFILRTKHGVFSFLGKHKRFVNVTGLKNHRDVENAIYHFEKMSKIDRFFFYGFSIDVLTIKSWLGKGQKENFFNKKSDIFHVFETSRFPATIIKINDQFSLKIKASVLYFNKSGIVILTGLQSVSKLPELILLLKKEFDLK